MTAGLLERILTIFACPDPFRLYTLPQEPLTPSILACLEHRHSFVRRNAVLAINALYKLPKGELLLQDAPELIEKVLQVRTGNLTFCHSKDTSCPVGISCCRNLRSSSRTYCR